MKVTEMTQRHLINRIAYFERMLANNPGEQYYMGNSDAAEDAVECENMHNEALAEKIKGHIKYMEKELKRRIIYNENLQNSKDWIIVTKKHTSY